MANALEAFLNHMATGGLSAELHRGAQLADFAKRRKLREQEMAIKQSQFDRLMPIQEQNAGSRALTAQTGAGALGQRQLEYREAPARMQQEADIGVAAHGRKRGHDLAKDPLALEQINDGADRFSGADITTGQNARQVEQGQVLEHAKGRGRGDAEIETKKILDSLGLLFSNNNSPEAMRIKAIIASELAAQKAANTAAINPQIMARGQEGAKLDTIRKDTQGRIGGVVPPSRSPAVQPTTPTTQGPVLKMAPAEAMARARALRPDLTGPDLAAFARKIAAGQDWE